MTLLVALLTLAAAPAAPAPPPPAPAPVDGLEAIEHVALPVGRSAVRLRVRALESLIVLEAPRDAAEVARAVRAAPRAVCPGLSARGSELRLTCRSRRIVARLVDRPRGALLEIWETRGLPWEGEDAPPLLPFDPPAVGLGHGCPGSTPGGRGECALARGDLDAARAALAEELIAADPAAGHAALRLGDLAYAAGDLRGAATHWARAHGQPWERAAAARLCELSAPCVGAASLAAAPSATGLPEPLARDLAFRRARALAFAGEPSQALRALAGDAASACASAPAVCQRLALLALREPGPAAVEALAVWVELPARDRGPAAYETELAAAAVAEREGAPGFAASVLAAAAARAPAAALPEHLLRTAEMYLAAGDPIRAGVVAEFARARAVRRALPGTRWAAVLRALTPAARRTASRTPPPAAPAEDVSALLAAADQATRAARALEGGTP
ncbi:hypothetical protein [Anaeromyxobacter diazotrophicus]|uniref:Tetratricopeptide repeat protein n=1 Tax=Anaeromyxobacter diazotrophicus TaxID=2590199 RepID=A0A7I9VKT2_9BACT|nr:hypothetical protein [Anaeromyxobacter diazotrophicus]GEJ57001.1 hypothetical protein AMYX_17420 [Anaeromyxobacter diazotrophicus]